LSNKNLVIFDGICNFCSASVLFIARRDPQEKYQFSAIQSDFAQSQLRKHQLNTDDIETFVLIKNGEAFVRSEAAFEILKDLGSLWRLLRLFRILPLGFRDAIYRLFARNRYRLFGKRRACMIPSDTFKSRFIS